MLAYVFWHRPRAGLAAAEYEAAQRSFHAALETPSACFRLTTLPFTDGLERVGDAPGDRYEDWYLVEDWAGLGRLNEAAVDAVRRADHDRAAAKAAAGWGAVYALQRGPAEIPAGAEWRDKPAGTSAAEFVDSLPSGPVWRRQLVLGPAPEFCVTCAPSPDRAPVWPDG